MARNLTEATTPMTLTESEILLIIADALMDRFEKLGRGDVPERTYRYPYAYLDQHADTSVPPTPAGEPPAPAMPENPTPPPEPTLAPAQVPATDVTVDIDEVRRRLAELSAQGHTDFIRDLIHAHHASKLTDLDPSVLPGLLAQVEEHAHAH